MHESDRWRAAADDARVRIAARPGVHIQFAFHGRLFSHDATMNRRTLPANANSALSSRAALGVLLPGMADIGGDRGRGIPHLP